MIPHAQISSKTERRGIMVRMVALVAVFALLASLAIVRDGRLFGHSFSDNSLSDDLSRQGTSEVINTTEAGKEFVGYGGLVPVEIYVTGGRIDSVKPLPNSETPSFFARLEEEGLVSAWDGKSLDEAASMPVDAVSGATYSSNALIGNVRAGVAMALDSGPVESSASGVISVVKLVVVLLVILCGAIVPFFVHNRVYRIVQELLNVSVLGFWAGCFIDYAMMLNLFSNSVSLSLAAVVSIMLLAVGFLFPLFGQGNRYCSWICPFGSMQELAGRLVPVKISTGAKWMRFLDALRQILWIVLLILLYVGWGASWVDYEIFTAFMVESVSWTVLVTGGVFIILSLFVKRPFCRFVCPTGSLLKQL